jgi:hypothetical protein
MVRGFSHPLYDPRITGSVKSLRPDLLCTSFASYILFHLSSHPQAYSFHVSFRFGSGQFKNFKIQPEKNETPQTFPVIIKRTARSHLLKGARE